MNTEERIAKTSHQLVTWLVEGDYEALEKYTANVRLTADLILEAVAEFGHPIVMPPDSAFEAIDAIPIANSDSQRWSVRIDLWTSKHAPSDLTLECTFIDTGRQLLSVEIDNLHVL